MKKPLLIFDGDCGFCRRWIARWRTITGDLVEYAPFQQVEGRFPELSKGDFSRSVVLIEADGSKCFGAEAVFRVLRIGGKKVPDWFYRKVPGVKFVTEAFYRLVASHRLFFSRLTRFLYGDPLERSTYQITRRVYFILLGSVYLFAFVSLALQIKGLVGRGGIIPAEEFTQGLSLRLGPEKYWLIPTIFWIHLSDFFLQFVCWAGAALSIALLFGFLPVPISFLLWLCYLSLFNIGGIFLGYQWDLLLLEVGFLSIFFAPWTLSLQKAGEPSHAVLWLLRWLLFRFMFSSGLVKLLSGDPTWWDLSALVYHYETQPLPTWIGYYAHQLPLWFQKISCAGMFAVELVVPFLIFTPRRTRMFGGLAMIVFQIFIMATGNYNFFNLLTIALCLTLFDDAAFRWMVRSWKGQTQGLPLRIWSSSGQWSKWVLGPVAVFLFLISWVPFLNRLEKGREWPTPIRQIYQLIDPLNLVNSYGLFAVMTTTRPEITVEGSNDGETWRAYEFKWKPGELRRRPSFVEPHQPRLDWQMWFQALAPYRQNSWFFLYLLRLLEGAPEVLSLMKTNPFPEAPPKYIRATISDYHFTDLETKRSTGRWWRKEGDNPYSPVLTLESP